MQHALAVIGNKGEVSYKYCSHYNTKEAYVDMNAGDIVPLCCREQWRNVNSLCHNHIILPNSKNSRRLVGQRILDDIQGSRRLFQPCVDIVEVKVIIKELASSLSRFAK